MSELDPAVVAQIETRTGELRRILDTRKAVEGHIHALEVHTDVAIAVSVIPVGGGLISTEMPTSMLLANEMAHLSRLNVRLAQLGAILPSEPAPPPPWAPKVEPVAPAPLPIPPTTKDTTNG